MVVRIFCGVEEMDVLIWEGRGVVGCMLGDGVCVGGGVGVRVLMMMMMTLW